MTAGAKTRYSPETTPELRGGAPGPARTYPSLYQINTRVLLTTLSRELGRPATLDDVPDAELDRHRRQRLRLGVVPRRLADRRRGPKRLAAEPGVAPRISGHCCPTSRTRTSAAPAFAIRCYTVHTDFGGDAALERLRERIHAARHAPLLDFVPNHTAPDHPWVAAASRLLCPRHRFATGTRTAELHPRRNAGRPGVLAYGRDPYFSGWPDTLQLNYANPAVQEAMAGELENIAAMCDGVRCDMAMLILPDVFERTWGVRPPHSGRGAIARVRARKPGFVFMAEVYWDLEWTLQQQGFDYTYDKRLYDRLREGHARPVRDHFRADMDFQRKSARFLENHDEPRAAAASRPNITGQPRS